MECVPRRLSVFVALLAATPTAAFMPAVASSAPQPLLRAPRKLSRASIEGGRSAVPLLRGGGDNRAKYRAVAGFLDRRYFLVGAVSAVAMAAIAPTIGCTGGLPHPSSYLHPSIQMSIHPPSMIHRVRAVVGLLRPELTVGWGATTWPNYPARQCPSSAPAPPQGAWRLWAARHSQERDRPTGRPATASGARCRRLQSRRFRCAWRSRSDVRHLPSVWPHSANIRAGGGGLPGARARGDPGRQPGRASLGHVVGDAAPGCEDLDHAAQLVDTLQGPSRYVLPPVYRQ